MDSKKYIGMDVHQATISVAVVAVMDAAGKVGMDCVIETKAATILEFVHGLRGTLWVTFEEGTGAAWLYDLLKPHVAKVVVCDPNTAYPVCTDGQLACPPEDCGGIPGFYDLVEALSDPNHERHEEMLDWIGEFDPQAFSVESVNRMLTPLRCRRETSRGWVPTR